MLKVWRYDADAQAYEEQHLPEHLCHGNAMLRHAARLGLVIAEHDPGRQGQVPVVTEEPAPSRAKATKAKDAE